MTLYLLRKQKHLTAADMAEKLQISRGYYSHLENGTRALTEDLIEKIADMLTVSKDSVSAIAAVNNEKIIPSSWIFRIQIDEKPFIQAFPDFVKAVGARQISVDEMEDMVAKFITYRIEHSVRNELKKNPDIAEYLMRAVNHSSTYNSIK